MISPLKVPTIKSLLLSSKEHLFKLGLKGKISSMVMSRKISHSSDLDKLDTDQLKHITDEVKEAELRVQ